MEGLHLEYNSENVIYLITCRNCIARFWTRFINYRNCHRKFCKGHSVAQVQLYAHFMYEHCSIDNWETILIDKGCK